MATGLKFTIIFLSLRILSGITEKHVLVNLINALLIVWHGDIVQLSYWNQPEDQSLRDF